MKDKLDSAKSKLMLEHPYFGVMATNLTVKENNTIASIAKKGDVLEINSEYLEVLNVDEVCTILANASLSQQLFHTQRGEAKIKSIWSMASDYAINDMLYKNGFKIPPLLNFSSRFERLYAEEIYKILITETDIEDTESYQTKEERILEDLDYELFVEQLVEKYSKSGELPKDIERFVNIKNSQLPWRNILYKFIDQFAKIDYTLNPPNKKYLYQKIALPSIRGEELNLAIAIDTSGSIDNIVLDSFISEVEAIMQTHRNYKITLIECDYKIRAITEYQPPQKITTRLTGDGTTDFREVFEYVESNSFECLIYFSDAKGIFPTKEPATPTLWILTKDETIPFGEKIVLLSE